MAEEKAKETLVIKGVPASEGIAVSKAFILEEEELHIIPVKIPKPLIKKEITRYNFALSQVRNEMVQTREKVLNTLGKEHTPLCDAYLIMLEDPLLNKDIIRQINEELINAEYALWTTIDKVITSFEKIEDEYFRERKNDIQYLAKRILYHLTGKHRRTINEAEPNSIIIAHNLSPADGAALKERKVKGFAIDTGGKTSHIALTAQGLEIPAVVGLKNISYSVNSGDTVVIDGTQGIVIVNPDEQTLNNYQHEFEVQIKEKEELTKLRDLPAQTQDGHKVLLTCNIDNEEELKSVLVSGSEGIGLFRTEYLYMNRTTIPSEEELYDEYKKIAQKMLPYAVTIRTLDLGGDKLAHFGLEGITAEANPFLGLRAIRLCLKFPELFKTQLRAILRASASGKLRIMFPMISGIDEFLKAKQFTQEIKADLARENKPFDETIEIGAMIEVPSAAVTSDIIAREADFLSIGTNDLIQYTLAVDRMSESVAFMYEPLHLSILRLLKSIIDSAHNSGKWVAMCGEMAADTDFTKILIGMGLNEFSMPAAMIPKIKKTIRSVNLEDAKMFVGEIFDTNKSESLATRLRKTQVI